MSYIGRPKWNIPVTIPPGTTRHGCNSDDPFAIHDIDVGIDVSLDEMSPPLLWLPLIIDVPVPVTSPLILFHPVLIRLWLVNHELVVATFRFHVCVALASPTHRTPVERFHP